MSDAAEIVVAAEQPHIAVIRIVNPFDPRDHVREFLPWQATKPLADYLPAGTAQTVVSLNGRIISPGEYGITYLGRDDNLVICPVPQGGGDSKGILGMIAMIAVMVVAPYAAAALNGAMGLGLTAGSLGMTMLTAGITMAGGMLVNSLLAPPKPKAPQIAGIQDDGSSYGIDGAKNTAVEGVVVPVVYGEFRTAGNILDLHVLNTGDTQLLNVRIAVSEGEIDSIYGIELNDQPIARFPNVQADYRMGAASQAVMGWFADIVRPENKGLKLTTDWTYHTTGNIDKFRIDVVAPSGLYRIDPHTGAMHARDVDFEILYRPLGTSAWSQLVGTTYQVGTRRAIETTPPPPTAPTGPSWWDDNTNAYYILTPQGYQRWYPPAQTRTWKFKDNNQPVVEQWQINHLNATASSNPIYVRENESTEYYIYPPAEGDIPVYATLLRMTDNRRIAVRRSFESPLLSRGLYEIAVRRINPENTANEISDVVYLSDVNEILTEDMAYPHTAMLGLRIPLSEQINGLPKITYRVRGKKVRVNRLGRKTFEPRDGKYHWFVEFSDNPAWILYDILTNTRYGAGMAESRLDLDAFRAWAAHCEAKGLRWNGPFESAQNVWDACQLVLRVGHAQLIGVGTRLTVVTESASDPVMMFSVANMIDGTFKETWLPIADRANEIEVTFFDAADNFKQRTIKVYDPAALAAGRPSRSSSITLYGVTSHDRAFKEALFQLNLNRYIQRTIEFGAPLEAIACRVGDVILVQHDMPQWGVAGRLDAGSTASVLNLDRDVTLEAGKTYKILVTQDAVLRATGTVTNIVGTSVFLTGFDGTRRVKRLKFGSLDREVMSTFSQGSGSYGVVLDDVSGISITGTYELWDTDVLEERDVVNTGTTTRQVTLQSPLPAAPAQFVHWMFGEVGKFKKPFRVKAITGSHEYRRDIVAIEYNASVYDLESTPVPTPNYSSLESGVRHPIIEGVEESLFLDAGAYKSHVTVFFSSDQSTYSRSSVYARVNSGAYTLIDGNALDRATIDLNEGDVVTFKVVARDIAGAIAADSTAPTRTHKVLGKTAPPANVAGFTASIAPGSLMLKWAPNPDIDLAGYEIREGASWDTATVVVTNFSGTSYPLPKNAGGTYVFRIRAIDTGGRYSTTPSVATITLSPPAAVVGFDCVQNGNRIEFRWDANSEEYLRGYEIREGSTWATAMLVTRVSATTYSMPANTIPGARTFWIKAIIEPGLESTTAVFATTEVAVSSDRNLLIETDQHAEGWPGVKYRMEVDDAGVLRLGDGFPYGEYTFGIDLPTTYRANNSIYSSLGAVALDTTTWGQAAWNWSQHQASRPWTLSGDIASVDVRYYISKNEPLSDSYIEGFGLHGVTTGAKGTIAAQSIGVTWGQGRYLQGAKIGDMTRLNWNLAVPAEFNTTFWVMPATVEGSQVFWSGVTADGLSLMAGFDADIGHYYLEDSLGGRMAIAGEFAPGDAVLVCIVQTATTRRLYIGKPAEAPASVSAALQPIGALVAVRLHQ